MRYIVWACFGVDADNPEQAKGIVNRLISPTEDAGRDLWICYHPNISVFISPELDKMLDKIEEG